ncbi:MAG: hypothetical protein ACAH12_07865 [Methylophilaceae bacterium]
MTEIKKRRFEDHPDLDLMDDLEDFSEVLADTAYYVGSIIIEFNSLEAAIEYFIAEQLTHAGDQDDRTYVFLSEMMYQGKAKALINLYGQIIESAEVTYTQNDLTSIQDRLDNCARIRNEYAHANWHGINQKRYVCVKTQANKKGIFQKYRIFDDAQMESDLKYIIESQFILGEFNENIFDQFYKRQ